MVAERFKPDANFKAGGVVGGYSSADANGAVSPTVLVIRIDPTTNRLLVDVNGADTVAPGDAVDAALTGTLMMASNGTTYRVLKVDSNDNLFVSLGTLLSGEDQTNNLLVVEERYNYYSATADGQVKASPGFIHTVTFSATGIVTAGVITIYDSLTETGTVIWSGTLQIGLNPTTITLDEKFLTGCYIGYDGTIANVRVNASFR